MIVAVVGSRKAQVSPERIFQALPEGCSCIVTGGAKGVDTAAAQCARLPDEGNHLNIKKTGGGCSAGLFSGPKGPPIP